MGRSATRGAFDELLGEDRDQPVLTELEARLLEDRLMARLGRQLGEGLADGATTIPPEKRRELEETLEALVAVASHRMGRGLREDVGPEFRAIVRRDIVDSFAQGLRGDLGDALDEAVDRAATRAVDSALDRLIERLAEPEVRYTLGDLLRDSVNDAVEGGSPTSPGIGATLETTLTTNLLDPFQDSVGGVTDRVAYRITESAQRTENLLRTIISGLVIVLVVLGVLYIVRDRQARRARETSQRAAEGLRTVGAALDQLDDEGLRQLKRRLSEYENLLVEETTRRGRRGPASEPKEPDRGGG
jgi:hypothetical protein